MTYLKYTALYSAFLEKNRKPKGKLVHKKKPMLESLFNKVAFLRAGDFIKEDSDTGAFLWNFQTFYRKLHKFKTFQEITTNI